MIGQATTYRNGPYSVNVGPDGAIVVNPGDWLSKYSAAIHNDFIHVNEFARADAAGHLHAVDNVNLIRAGETLYHIPTVMKTAKLALQIPKPPALPDAQQKQLILNTLAHDFRLDGDKMVTLKKVMDGVELGERAVTLAEIAGLVAEEGFISATGTVAGMLGTILAPVLGLMMAGRASSANEHMAGLRGMSYAATAWAFNDPRPNELSPTLANYLTLPGVIKSCEKAWREAVDQTYARMEHMARGDSRRARIISVGGQPVPQPTKETYQLLLKALFDRNRQKMAESIMRGLEGELTEIELIAWQANYSIKYPR